MRLRAGRARRRPRAREGDPDRCSGAPGPCTATLTATGSCTSEPLRPHATLWRRRLQTVTDPGRRCSPRYGSEGSRRARSAPNRGASPVRTRSPAGRSLVPTCGRDRPARIANAGPISEGGVPPDRLGPTPAQLRPNYAPVGAIGHSTANMGVALPTRRSSPSHTCEARVISVADLRLWP